MYVCIYTYTYTYIYNMHVYIYKYIYIYNTYIYIHKCIYIHIYACKFIYMYIYIGLYTPFSLPVSVEEYPDYYEQIKHPMDLDAISKRAKGIYSYMFM
jgi:hypothetical protein